MFDELLKPANMHDAGGIVGGLVSRRSRDIKGAKAINSSYQLWNQ